MESRWLFRWLAVDRGAYTHRVVYDGRGLGSEMISVDGVLRRRQSLLWFEPRFEMIVTGITWRVDVRVSPWLRLRDLWVYADELLVYSERAPPPPTRF